MENEDPLLIWDLENTQIPREWGISHSDAIKNMKELLKKCLPNSGRAEIVTCANGKYISDELREALYSAGVDMTDVPSGSNSADVALMIKTFEWARKHRPPSYMVFISGDRDFYKVIETVSELGYTSILAYPEERTANPLKSVADYTIGMKNLFFGTDLFSRIERRTRSSVQVQLGVQVELKTSTQIQELGGDVSGVYWDAISCSIQMCDHKKALEYILTEVATFENPVKIHVYGDSTKLPATPELRGMMGATYTQTSETKEECLENCMIADILRFTFERSTSSTIVIITGNRIFARVAQSLRKLGYKVFLVVPNGVDQDLKDSADTLFNWPPRLRTQRPQQTYYLPPAARKARQ